MKNKKTILVIAYKYNDILYAINTKEFLEAEVRFLLIFSLLNLKASSFPHKDKFDSVYEIPYKKDKKFYSTIKIYLQLKSIFKKVRVNTISLSNPFMIYNHMVISRLKVRNVILLEDGLMNYSTSVYKNPLSKKIIYFLLRTNFSKLTDKISKTYLFAPKEAKVFYGVKKELILSSNYSKNSDIESLEKEIQGKNIFVGQNLYPLFCSKKQYYELVQEVILKYRIEFYLPHPYEIHENQLQKVKILNLSTYSTTLENIAVNNFFNVFSFGSSVLFTTKKINSEIVSSLISVGFYDIFSKVEVLKNCDNYLKL